MEIEIYHVLLLIVVGVIAGVLNIIAGGGSLLTLPVLIFLGLPSATANGTNRIAIFCQNVFAIAGFKKQGVFPARLALLCTAPALIGSYFGARFAIDIDDLVFQKILAVIMIVVLIITLIDPAKYFISGHKKMTPIRLTILLISFFGVGFYGGFVQAGVGFIIITALLIQGLDLVRINAIKVIVVFFFTMVALVVFVQHGQIDYGLGVSLAVGNSIGGWIGSQLSVKKGHTWLKHAVSCTVFLFAIKLFFG